MHAVWCLTNVLGCDSSPVKVMTGCSMTRMETLWLTTLIYKWAAQLPALPVITQVLRNGAVDEGRLQTLFTG